jgi:cation-transporting ATPase 13A2
MSQMYAGPISESVPSSITSFAHRRTRADSTASFTYFEDNDEAAQWESNENAIDEDDSEEELSFDEFDVDLEDGRHSIGRRKSSTVSRPSAEDLLLHRHDSARTDVSGYGRQGRLSQKIYILTEDLTIVVAGFSTHAVGSAVYLSLCVLSLGLAYLLFRWLPKWRVRLVGTPTPLKDCTWVVIEVS